MVVGCLGKGVMGCRRLKSLFLKFWTSYGKEDSGTPISSAHQLNFPRVACVLMSRGELLSVMQVLKNEWDRDWRGHRAQVRHSDLAYYRGV